MRRALAIVTIMAALTTPQVAHAQPVPEKAWLALGDSYSSGEGIEDTPASPSTVLGKDCRRATGIGTKATAWPAGAYQLVQKDLDLKRMDFVACTGNITDHAAAQMQEAGGSGKWDVVSFSFGGNNIRFSDIIQGCLKPEKKSWKDYDFGCKTTEDQVRRRVDMLVGKTPIEPAEFAGSVTLPQLYDLVAQHVTPGGHVLVVGYPNLIEEVDRWGSWRKRLKVCSGVLARDVPFLRNAGRYLNEQIAQAVAAAGRRHQAAKVRFHFMDIAKNPYELTDDPRNRHARCTDDPWLNGIEPDTHQPGAWFYKDRSFHPHQKGHTNTARVIAEFIRANVKLDGTGRPPQGQVDQMFQGHWRSPEPAIQPTSPKTYWVDIVLRNGPNGTRVGDILYPGLDCSGSLTLVESRPDKLTVTEHIDSQPNHPCIIDGTVTLTPTAAGLDYQYNRAGESTITVTAKLVRA